jgi:hypothetical protein
VQDLENSSLTFNNEVTLVSGLLAGGAHLRQQLTSLIREHKEANASGVLAATSRERKAK